ncbi:MAG: RNA methyltransferase [Lachnospiraceae bacterium]|jgi:TrmH family RNA methyltransferase|nr:RNA methyltransferase [Lachnospiraceae bacterium]
MITSTTNPHIKRICKLQTQAKAREEERVFVIEGTKLFLEAPEQLLQEVYITEYCLCKLNEDPQASQKIARFAYETVSEAVMQRMSATKTPQGLLCVVVQDDIVPRRGGCPHPPVQTAQDEIAPRRGGCQPPAIPGVPPLYLLLEDIQDPGNLGTIIRTAEAAGVTAVILGPGCADIYNPKTVRATMGSIFRVPFASAVDLVAEIARLQTAGVQVYAACLEEATPYVNQDYRGATAFLLGNEGAGLSQAAKDAATGKIMIPMSGAVESLNAATAAAVLLYEAVRQRGAS